MRRILVCPAVFCSILAMVVLSIDNVQADLPPAPVDIGGDFTLTGTDGKPVSLGDFKDQIVLLFFGYTYCPDVCPTAMLTLQNVRGMLGEKASRVNILFITVDPERDTLETLKPYMAYFGSSFIGLRGSLQETARVAALYRTSYRKVETDSASEYLVAHSDFIYLIDDQGRTRSMYRSHTPTKKIVDDILELMN
ncbi:MAG: SCO family protein [Gammaproteobacteria bacterium]|nr:SCO family protein [Gammaproteobacteria bacterium]